MRWIPEQTAARMFFCKCQRAVTQREAEALEAKSVRMPSGDVNESKKRARETRDREPTFLLKLQSRCGRRPCLHPEPPRQHPPRRGVRPTSAPFLIASPFRR